MNQMDKGDKFAKIYMQTFKLVHFRSLYSLIFATPINDYFHSIFLSDIEKLCAERDCSPYFK